MKEQIKAAIIKVLDEKYLDGNDITNGYIPDIFDVVEFIDDITNEIILEIEGIQ